MNRLLTSTALALVLGLSPALAQQPADETADPPALQQPQLPSEQQPSEAIPSPTLEPSDPATPIPGERSEMPQAQPDPSSPPAQSSEAPAPVAPAPSASAGAPQFLSKQDSSDFLASNLIGESVYNNADEAIGAINDLVTDESGKVVAVLIGHGGFLGLGQKDVAIRFEDLKLSRDADNDIKVVANLSNEVLASAPDYETLSEQTVAVGASDTGERSGTSDTY